MGWQTSRGLKGFSSVSSRKENINLGDLRSAGRAVRMSPRFAAVSGGGRCGDESRSESGTDPSSPSVNEGTDVEETMPVKLYL